MDSLELLRIAKTLHERKTMDGSSLRAGNEFSIGVAADPCGSPDPSWQARRSAVNLLAGAVLLFTQPILHDTIFQQYVQELLDHSVLDHCYFIAGVPLVTVRSHANSMLGWSPSHDAAGNSSAALGKDWEWLLDPSLDSIAYREMGIHAAASAVVRMQNMQGVNGVLLYALAPGDIDAITRTLKDV